LPLKLPSAFCWRSLVLVSAANFNFPILHRKVRPALLSLRAPGEADSGSVAGHLCSTPANHHARSVLAGGVVELKAVLPNISASGVKAVSSASRCTGQSI
jgi:hypothetical protein